MTGTKLPADCFLNLPCDRGATELFCPLFADTLQSGYHTSPDLPSVRIPEDAIDSTSPFGKAMIQMASGLVETVLRPR
jgi:hypothetical protein